MSYWKSPSSYHSSQNYVQRSKNESSEYFDFFLKKNFLNHDSKVLEIGSNSGSHLKFLKKKFNCNILGIDINQNYEKHYDEGEFICKDLNTFNLKKINQSFDLVFSIGTLININRPGIINEIISISPKYLLIKERFLLKRNFLNSLFFKKYDDYYIHNFRKISKKFDIVYEKTFSHTKKKLTISKMLIFKKK